MARIFGVFLPENKRMFIALTYIYGIGRSRSAQILKNNNIDPNVKVKSLSENQWAQLRSFIETEFEVGDAPRAKMEMNIRSLIEKNCYQGIRHKKKLPVRGQRTRTNAQTRKRHRASMLSRSKQSIRGKKK